MRTGFRFDPPKIELDVETAWVFARAFGPVDRAFADRVDGRRAVEAADRLALTARVGARVPAETLVGEVGAKAAAVISDRFRMTAALAMAAQGMARQIAAEAANLDVPIVILKGVALQITDQVTIGARAACDVDVLTSASAAGELQSALLAGEFEQSGFRPSSHQLAAIVHSCGLFAEIHTQIPGLTLDGSNGGATLDDLKRARLIHPVSGYPGKTSVPDQEVLVAHVVVHGLAQHGLAPDEYPMTKMLADLQDLGVDSEGGGGSTGRRFQFASQAVSSDEVDAVVTLLDRLRTGEDPRNIASREDRAGTLLRHIVAGVVDHDYQKALKIMYFRSKGSGLHVAGALGYSALRALWPTRTQLDVIFGKPKTSIGYAILRIWRPFDLVGRAVRYGRAWFRHQRRR